MIDRLQPAEDATLTTLVHRLVQDARAVGEAEIAVYRARATGWVARFRNAAIFFAAAAILALSALIALLVGLVLTLATLVGPGFATMIVVGAVLTVAVVLALVGRAKLTGKGPVR